MKDKAKSARIGANKQTKTKFVILDFGKFNQM